MGIGGAALIINLSSQRLLRESCAGPPPPRRWGFLRMLALCLGIAAAIVALIVVSVAALRW